MARIIVCVFAVVTIYIIVCLQCNVTNVKRQYRSFEALRAKQNEIPEDEKAAARAVASRMARVYETATTLQADVVIQNEGYYPAQKKYIRNRVDVALQMAPEKLRADITINGNFICTRILNNGLWTEVHALAGAKPKRFTHPLGDDPNGVPDPLYIPEGYEAYDCVLGQFLGTWVGPKSTKVRKSFEPCLSVNGYLGKVTVEGASGRYWLFFYQGRPERMGFFYLTEESCLYRWTTIYFKRGTPVLLETRTFENLRIDKPVARPWDDREGGENTPSTTQ